MIEILLQAERTLSMGRLDEAERLYRLVADADPHDAIALVGLARVAAERADDARALGYARQALALDSQNPAAARLVERLTDLAAERAPTIPPAAGNGPAPAAVPAPVTAPITAPISATLPASAPDAAPASARSRGFLARFRRKP
ncbi:MAG: hypothetical protein IVW53_05095 [Chloroflexi bacterium]|nr:hypothetical protein [Chloroflexota bacterium]